MKLNNVPAGQNIPDDIYVIIEISAHSSHVKYEIDKETGMLFVDRFISPSMFYPCNYGYINHTLSLDNDPVDVLIPTPYCLHPYSVIHGRPIGMLKMIDESGEDCKILAVPHEEISLEYQDIQDIEDVSNLLKEQILHFFAHYKDLEVNKWVKIVGWGNAKSAKQEILCSYNRVIKKCR